MQDNKKLSCLSYLKMIQSASIMPIEGGGRFEHYARRSPEDPFGRGIEPHGDHTPEDAVERENYWLSGIISPERLERIREYPAYEGHSTEWIIMEALLATLVEKGGDMDQQAKARLRNLTSTFRVLMVPNLTPNEQGFMGDLAKATSVNWSAMRTEITPDTISDVRWLWGTFGLRRPTEGAGRTILGDQPRRPRIQPPQGK